ncbi:MAG TPA: type II secretion system protein N [Burkholderiales bacterium]|nr:type II secretion system protein N [Burkholderiales bacterium]
MLRESWIAALELAIVVALALSLAVWTWQLFAPRTLAAPAPSSLGAGPVGAAPLAARSLLGASGASASATVRAGSGGALTLVGVFAAPAPGTGRALIARGGDRPQLVAAGEEIAPGVALNEVHADHVTVLRGGALERIELERRGAGGSQPLTPVQPQAPVRPRED